MLSHLERYLGYVKVTPCLSLFLIRQRRGDLIADSLTFPLSFLFIRLSFSPTSLVFNSLTLIPFVFQRKYEHLLTLLS